MNTNYNWQTQQLNLNHVNELRQHAAKQRLVKMLTSSQSHVNIQTAEVHEGDYVERFLTVSATPA